MTYIVEYVTHHAVGRSTIDSGNFHDALTKAERALTGLPGIKSRIAVFSRVESRIR
ncbi:hypothetical protein [Arthrobacter sp. 754]|uniref:hypothetical protein n=1 Tax=Arthrobacter sp. 754 TaxID=3156315 RepID=UPI003393AB02